MFQYLSFREIGFHHPRILESKESARRTFSLALSGSQDLACPHSAVNSLDVDYSEGRYLLSGGADCTAAVFDLESVNIASSGDSYHIKKKTTIAPLFVIPRSECHDFAISAVQWYYNDTGLFFTGSHDHTIKVWDTNALKAVRTFRLEHRVHTIGLPTNRHNHSLIAAGTGDAKGRLCDIRSGNTSHVLQGHREAIRAVKWCPSNEFMLATGSEDKTIRFWDIRKAGCLMNLAQHGAPETAFQNKKFKLTPQSALVKPALVTAHDGAINSMCFTPDGNFLLSIGTDNRMHCWNTHTGVNTLVNYPQLSNTSINTIQIAVSRNGGVVFVPTKNNINAYHVHTGELLYVLQGHFERVRCSVFHTKKEELFSGAGDQQILAWDPQTEEQDEEIVDDAAPDEDDWSDDD